MLDPKELLNKICLRSKNKEGEWDSLTLQEIIDIGRPEEVFFWIIKKMSSYEENAKVTQENIEHLIVLLPESRYVRLK